MYWISFLLACVLPGAVMAQTANSTLPRTSPQIQQTEKEGTLTTLPPDVSADEKGILSYIDFNGNWNDLGHMLATGFSLGYQFNRHVSVDARVPFYYLSASTTTTQSTETLQPATTDSGIGDPSFALQLRFPNHILDLRTRLTTWVPVADIQSGLSTGSVLVDWTTQFSHPVGRLLPYAQIGIANTVPETPLFLLPYTAEGFNTRLEGGSHLLLTRSLSAGASFYDVLPSGTQTLYSREYHGGQIGPMGTGGGPSSPGYGHRGGASNGGDNNDSGNGAGNGSGGSGGGKNRNGFMTQQVTKGDDMTRDHGLSAWLTATLPYYIDMQVGICRSVDYDLNTFSIGFGFDPLRAFRHRQK